MTEREGGFLVYICLNGMTITRGIKKYRYEKLVFVLVWRPNSATKSSLRHLKKKNKKTLNTILLLLPR